MENQKATFKFELDNLSEKQDVIRSPKFASSSGCEWSVSVYLNGNLSMYLYAQSLKPGCIIRAMWGFSLWDTSGELLCDTPKVCRLFCDEDQGQSWGYDNMLSLSDKKKLIIEVGVKVVEVGHEGDVRWKEMINVNGFEVLPTQVSSFREFGR